MPLVAYSIPGVSRETADKIVGGYTNTQRLLERNHGVPAGMTGASAQTPVTHVAGVSTVNFVHFHNSATTDLKNGPRGT